MAIGELLNSELHHSLLLLLIRCTPAEIEMERVRVEMGAEQ